MSAYAALLDHLTTHLPDLVIGTPALPDLPARKQQDASALYALLQPVFVNADGSSRVYPLTAVASDGTRPLPDCVYGAVRASQRLYAHAPVATVTGFVLEIRAASYADLLTHEDAVRGVISSTNGFEAVDASEDYDAEVGAYVSQLEVEIATPTADALLLETATKPTGQPLSCGDYYPLQAIEYRILTLHHTHAGLLARRDQLRTVLNGWQAGAAYDPLRHLDGESIALEAGLFGWTDTYTHTFNTGVTP